MMSSLEAPIHCPPYTETAQSDSAACANKGERTVTSTVIDARVIRMIVAAPGPDCTARARRTAGRAPWNSHDSVDLAYLGQHPAALLECRFGPRALSVKGHFGVGRPSYWRSPEDMARSADDPH